MMTTDTTDVHDRDDSTTDRDDFKHRIAHRLPTEAVSLAVGLGFLIVGVAPVLAAPDDVGTVYCDTGVETGIDLVFGAVAGLGLPATGYYMSKGGLSYMRAGGNPEKKNQAKERLVMSGVGFAIVVLALLSPELVDKIGSQMGFGFSDCVKPF
ncbi:pilin [Haloarchaeobius sp. FL176]|uniref:pilin n=1 Tax=Haloarchaeobius sp. FL176 TaxID=2967129 RepID=UPI0021481910|nr:pilin [Haloarchaeobius sp. FL176]